MFLPRLTFPEARSSFCKCSFLLPSPPVLSSAQTLNIFLGHNKGRRQLCWSKAWKYFCGRERWLSHCHRKKKREVQGMADLLLLVPTTVELGTASCKFWSHTAVNHHCTTPLYYIFNIYSTTLKITDLLQAGRWLLNPSPFFCMKKLKLNGQAKLKTSLGALLHSRNWRG